MSNRPQVNEPALSLETAVGASYRLDESLMERMMVPSEGAGTLPIPSSRLNIQRRMHPEIADILRATLYPYLQDHESTCDRASVPVMVDRVWWLNHQMPEDAQDPHSATAKSFSNSFEVEMVAGLVEYLVKSNEYDFRDITVLTPYNGQLAAFAERFTGTCSLWLSEKDREALEDEGYLDPEEASMNGKTEISLSSMLKLATIDNFQGEESRVVILSMVRSNDAGRIGFLKTANRINVGCSRARNGFYIVGNASLMSGVPMWQQISDTLSAKGKMGPDFRTCCPRHPDRIYSVYSLHQWTQIPECEAPCDKQLPCGHACGMMCHAPSLHDRKGCEKPCTKIHESCGHQCMKTCGERCGDCTFPVQKITLRCGHEATRTCGQDETTDDIKCDAVRGYLTLKCGHLVEVKCSWKGKPLQCQATCGKILECGHHCTASCHTCSTSGHHSQCVSACSKELPCGHQCAAPCHQGACPTCHLPCQRSCKHGCCPRECWDICDPCVRSCGRKCPHLGPCKTMCCLPCDHLPCSEPCTALLPCGHLCPSLCGEVCPLTCRQCTSEDFPIKTQMFLSCGHSFDLDILDNHVGISNLYEIDGDGRIRRPSVALTEVLTKSKVSCPMCGSLSPQVRRYALHAQILAFQDNIDRLYANFSRKFHTFSIEMWKVKHEMDCTYEASSKALKPGPLSGRSNQELVHKRGNKLNWLQKQITEFNGRLTFEITDLTTLTLSSQCCTKVRRRFETPCCVSRLTGSRRRD